MHQKQLVELLLQSLEHEMGGVQVYTTALRCVQNEELEEEWEKYLEETKTHVAHLEAVFAELGLDPKADSPGRKVVRHVGKSLVKAMEMALDSGDAAAAELVACECVVLAETKDHANWQLLGKCAEHFDGKGAAALQRAASQVEDEEDEHLYHTKGWCRELWIQALGMTAVLPPPEEQHHVKTAIGASRAEQAADRQR